MEKMESIYQIETADEALIRVLFKETDQLKAENDLLREANEESARQIEFLTVECKMWRKIHEADQAAIESIIKQMGANYAQEG